MLNLLHQIVGHLFDLEHSRGFYMLTLVLNTIYIYWIGFIGYTKSNLLFKNYAIKDEENSLSEEGNLKSQLTFYVDEQEIFTNQNLKVIDLANLLGITEKELSLFIHENFGKTL